MPVQVRKKENVDMQSVNNPFLVCALSAIFLRAKDIASSRIYAVLRIWMK